MERITETYQAKSLSLIQGVLDDFKDAMPPELLKNLSPRREVDHEIELEQRAKAQALVPYRMAPPELEELQRQLKDLLNAGYIYPSNALFGRPVLFQKKKDGSLWILHRLSRSQQDYYQEQVFNPLDCRVF